MKRKDNSPETIALCRAYRTSYLIAGFIRGTLTDEEQEELEDWIIADKANIHLFSFYVGVQIAVVYTRLFNVAAAFQQFHKI